MLDLAQVDLQDLCQALEDNSQDHSWWLDPRSGELELWSEDLDELDEVHPEDRGLAPVEPIESSEAYRDMEDFVARIRDPRARERLEQAIAGRGAFRRFKDGLFDFPELRAAWFQFHDARMERRALHWLADNRLVDAQAAERAAGAREDPAPPELSGPFDARAIAEATAADLRELYGDRLQRVLLFGSWARGDAHIESDIDLLVVLDDMASSSEEGRRMDDVLWRRSFENTTVVSAVPVRAADTGEPRHPFLIRALKEGIEVG